MGSLDKINQYMNDGDYKKAIAELDIIISKEPNNAAAFYMRGKSAFIELQNERYDEYDEKKALIYSTIEYDLYKSIEIDPNITDAYRGLMYLNRVLKNTEKEREFAQILLEKDENSYDALLMLGNGYLNNGKSESDFHQAIGYYDDFIKKADREEGKIARFERGLCYYNLNILPKADLEANKLIEDFPFFDEAYFLKGITLSKLGIDSEFYEDVVFFFNRAIDLNPRNYDAIYEKAEWHLRKGEYKKAVENYDKLFISKNKHYFSAMLGKAQALHDFIVLNEDESYKGSETERKDLEEVFDLIDKIIKESDIYDLNARYIYYKCNLYSRNGEINKAREEFNKIAKETNRIPAWLYHRMAEFYYRYAENGGDYKKALSYLKKIGKEDREIATYNLLIFCNYELKNYLEIVNICEEFFKDNFKEEEVYYIRFIYAYSLQMTNSHNYELIIDNYKICLNSDNLDRAFIYRSLAKIMMYNMTKKYYMEGLNMLKLSMKLNDPLSYYVYSKELFYGNIVSPCPEIAIGLANASIELDDTLECSYIIIGRGYELGRGVKRNVDKAFEAYRKADEISEINNSKRSCSKAAMAHCYYNGIGVERNENLALDIVRKTAEKRGKYSHDYIGLLYSYFALMDYEGFSLKKALTLFDETLPYYSDLSVVMTLKRLYKKLGRKSDLKRMIRMENETLKYTGEFNLNYLREYIKNFDDYYPIPFLK